MAANIAPAPAVGFDLAKITPLKRDNYVTWARQIRILLRGRGEWQVTQNEAAPGATADLKDRAMTTISLTIAPELLYIIDECTTPKQIWDKLAQYFMGNNTAKKFDLKEQLTNIKQASGESIDDFYARADTIKCNLAAIGFAESHDDFVMYFLKGLHSKYNTVVTILKMEAAVRPVMEILGILKSHEKLLQEPERAMSFSDKALFSKGKHNKHGGSTSSNGESEKEPICYKCHKPGHFSPGCPLIFRKGSYRRHMKPNGHAKFAKSDEINEIRDEVVL